MERLGKRASSIFRLLRKNTSTAVCRSTTKPQMAIRLEVGSQDSATAIHFRSSKRHDLIPSRLTGTRPQGNGKKALSTCKLSSRNTAIAMFLGVMSHQMDLSLEIGLETSAIYKTN